MEKFFKKISFAILIINLIVLTAPMVAIGQTTSGGFPQSLNDQTNLPTSADEVVNVLNSIIDWVFWILLFGAAIMILVGAFFFLTSGGDEQKTTTARNYILYALIAIVVAFLSKGLVGLVRYILDQSRLGT
jgi:drug/metabolite transporter (DMT)-like permease